MAMSDTRHEALHRIVKRPPSDFEPWGERSRKKDRGPDCSCGCRWFIPLEPGLRQRGCHCHIPCPLVTPSVPARFTLPHGFESLQRQVADLALPLAFTAVLGEEQDIFKSNPHGDVSAGGRASDHARPADQGGIRSACGRTQLRLLAGGGRPRLRGFAGGNSRWPDGHRRD